MIVIASRYKLRGRYNIPKLSCPEEVCDILPLPSCPARVNPGSLDCFVADAPRNDEIEKFLPSICRLLLESEKGNLMKTPLKATPLRNPGQNLDEYIQDYIQDNILVYLFTSFVMIVFALVEWSRWYFELPPNPRVYAIVAIITVAFSAYKVVKARKKVKHLKLGRDGEKIVGQYLESLREYGVRVFHDIPANGFNLDHVAISKNGIYVIETKTYSKPSKGKAVITFNGSGVSINGFHDQNPVNQVRAAANWLKNTLKESTGKNFNIQPVIIYPGWFVESTPEAKGSAVWVLNPKALPKFITNSKEQYKTEDVQLASYHLSRYVRTYTE